jgi:hypothetical protein
MNIMQKTTKRKTRPSKAPKPATGSTAPRLSAAAGVLGRPRRRALAGDQNVEPRGAATRGGGVLNAQLLAIGDDKDSPLLSLGALRSRASDAENSLLLILHPVVLQHDKNVVRELAYAMSLVHDILQDLDLRAALASDQCRREAAKPEVLTQ